MTALSCTFAPSPTEMVDSSPRNTAPNQTLAPAAISTSPMRTAVGAMYASACTRGLRPRNSNSKGLYNSRFVFNSLLALTRG